MANIQAEIRIPEIQRTMNVSLYFPADLSIEVGNKVRGVITLLHGYTNVGNDWMTMTPATRYAADNGYILVAPSVDNSFYADMAYGAQFYTALTEYLPQKLDRIFHIPHQRELNHIAGLSMGGYGALRIGLSHPERYATIGSFSGVVNPCYMVNAFREDSKVHEMMHSVLGEKMEVPPEMDPFYLAQQVAKLPRAAQPRLFCTVGRQDTGETLYQQNQDLRAHLKNLPLDFTYAEWDGVHEWAYWDRSLAEFIGFIQGSNYASRKRGDWSATMTVEHSD